jgi:transcriptional regulator with XRE-family HTH domain
MIRHTLATNVKRLRLAAGLTQAQLAERANIGLATLQRIERAEGSASIDKLEALANVLNTTPSALLETTTMQELIIAIKTATDLDALTNAINDLADHIDGLDLDAHERAVYYDEQVSVDWTELPHWGEEPRDTRGVYSWDGGRLLWLEGYRASLTDRDDD